MKTITFITSLLFTILSIASEITQIDVVELNKRLTTLDKNTIILDVRTPLEQMNGVIKGAIKKNLYSFDFEEYVKGLDKTKTYLIYCHSGVRSANATRMLNKHKIKAINIKGGISAWKDKGYPLQK